MQLYLQLKEENKIYYDFLFLIPVMDNAKIALVSGFVIVVVLSIALVLIR